MKMPFLATVETLVDDRGFGFLTLEGSDYRIFFHATKVLSDQFEFTSLQEGEKVLCQIGSTPREPSKRAAVIWSPIRERDWSEFGEPESQHVLDLLRLEIFDNARSKQIESTLAANWYGKQWHGSPPADLDDPILKKVLLDALAALSPEDLQALSPATLGDQNPYAFLLSLDPGSDTFDVSTLLDNFSPDQLVAFDAPDVAWMQSTQTASTGAGLTDDSKATLLEWAYLCNDGQQADWCRKWLKGRDRHEAIFARRLLGEHNQFKVPLLRWLASLLETGLLIPDDVRELALKKIQAGVVLHDALAAADRSDLRQFWHVQPEAFAVVASEVPDLIDKLLRDGALAIDLETDGETIYQIGHADHRGAVALEGEDLRTSLAEGLPVLGDALASAKLTLGHNVLAWDWPILSRAAPTLPQRPIWDTLLVGFLLEPQAQSHALGSNHTADADAKATLDLFGRQAERFDTSLNAAVLTGACSSTETLFKTIVEACPRELSFRREKPGFLEPVDPNQPMLMAENAIRALDWIPGYVVAPVDASTPLDPAFLEIRLSNLRDALTEDQKHTPVVQVLMEVLQRATEQGISVRRNMLPAWLVQGLPWLSAALGAASSLPELGTNCQVSPIPASARWWAEAGEWSGQAILPESERLIIARNRDTAQAAGVDAVRGRTSLVATAGGNRWAIRDPAAERLDQGGTWRTFEVISPPASIKSLTGPAASRRCKPVLVSRRATVRYPGSRMQAGYWSEQLAALRSFGSKDIVPILLVSSSRSAAVAALLETAMAELAMGELRPQHRSRREHLKRAAANSFCIVDSLDRWRDWNAIGEDAGINLQPIVDAAPLEEWYALDTLPEAIPTGENVEISTAMLLDELDKRVATHLGPWLRETGLADSVKAPILMDPRLADSAHLVKRSFDWKPVEPTQWSEADSRRLDVVFAPLLIEREEAPSDIGTMERFLVKHWQPSGAAGSNAVSGFKLTQAEAMEHIRNRSSDVVVTLPTGEGKSVLFQVPALARGLRNRRLTLVISPLRALMRDQVNRLHEQGFEESVDFISGDLSREEQNEVLQGILDQRIVMLYVAPERLRVSRFIDVLMRRISEDGGLEYVVFDEAHCINQWGYEFRPDYFYAFSFLMSQLRTGNLEATPFLLLSATLTASDRRRLKGLLERLSEDPATLSLAICPNPETQVSPLRQHIRVSTKQMQGNILMKDENVLAERVPEIEQVIAKARENFERTGQRSAVVIFVAQRTKADSLAELLTRSTGCEVESFHAGLDGPTREDIYDRFRSGDFDILVATKAFGMGMDIPDIHWVVHLGPPNYLEDYLQEVGRIGRGNQEREQAGLDRLDALLLYSSQDFEGIRDMRAQNELRVPQIDGIEQTILSKVEVIEGTEVAFVPQDGFSIGEFKSAAKRRAEATRLRLALFWLESAGHIVQAGTVPDLIKISFASTALKAKAGEDSLAGKVAKAIWEATSERSKENQPTLTNLFLRLQTTVGILSSAEQADRDERRAVINLSQIRRQCRIESLDATMALVADLAQCGALTPEWTIDFTKRKLLAEPEARVRALMEHVTDAVRELLEHLREHGVFRFDPHDWYDTKAFRLAEPEDRHRSKISRETFELILREDRYERAFISGFRALARTLGIRLKQRLDEETDRIQWVASLAGVENENAGRRLEELFPQARALLALFPPDQSEGSVNVDDLISQMEAAHPQKTFHASDVASLLRLLSALNLVSALPELLPRSYILQALGREPGLAKYPELVAELDSVNELAGARNFGMEVYANLPEEARDRFIPGYFAGADVETLKSFMDEQLGEIEDESGVFAEKRNQLRATRATEFFSFYENSPEPAQWKAMTHPYNSHLLVNAGPGAGKTSVLVGRIVHLIREQHVKPSEIMVLAFNRAVVFEIRKRVRDLFRSLGYAAYASRVKVYTFHGLAMRSMDGPDGVPMDENLLATFARKLNNDPAFRKSVAGDCRALLIDEFQDVNRDVYQIIKAIYAGSEAQAGVMAIGDDDQDILRWQRNSEGGVFAEHYFDLFRKDFGGESLARLALEVNFRSGHQIVARSQKMIRGFFDRNTHSRRLKASDLKAVKGAPSGHAQGIVIKGESWNSTLTKIEEMSRRLVSENPGSLAVLCRSNDEVASVHRALSRTFDNVTVQSSDNIAIRSLRHIALWIDFLEREAARQDQALTDPLRASLLERFNSEVNIPETRSGHPSNPDLLDLWDLCAQENVFPHMSTLARFLQDLRSDELQRLLGAQRADDEILVSTIHKVKGLEYDNVIVVPSRTNFGQKSAAIEGDAAEEARLMYVALTRAKSRLVFYWGDRERAWGGDLKKFSGERDGGRIIMGMPDEVFISWSMCQSNFHEDPEATQAYIETSVSAGDQIELEGHGPGAYRSLMHVSATGERRQIGFLSNDVGKGNQGSDLTVCAIIRYSPKDDRRSLPAPTVAERGWGYVVLVEGVLR